VIKEKKLSAVSFLVGFLGIAVAGLPLVSEREFFGVLANGILAIIMGVAGFVISFRVSKTFKDDIVIGGMIVNPISVIFGIVSLSVHYMR